MTTKQPLYGYRVMCSIYVELPSSKYIRKGVMAPRSPDSLLSGSPFSKYKIRAGFSWCQFD